MSIIANLKKDHREIKSLCSRLKRTSERAEKTRKELFSKLADLVVSHAHAEEKVVYANLINSSKQLRPGVLEGYEEHHVADLLLREMARMPVSDERWTAKMEVLAEALDHHIEEEESDILPKMEKQCSDEVLEVMGKRFLALKEEEAQPGLLSKKANQATTEKSALAS